jgi:hypothetical protein
VTVPPVIPQRYEWCDVILRRFARFAGITPEVVRDGSAPKPVSFTGDQP